MEVAKKRAAAAAAESDGEETIGEEEGMPLESYMGAFPPIGGRNGGSRLRGYR